MLQNTRKTMVFKKIMVYEIPPGGGDVNHIWPAVYTAHVPKQSFQQYYMSRDMTKSTKWLCAQQRLRSAWASAQSNQSLRCPHEESLGPYLPTERTAKTLLRLGGCRGSSESSLGAHSFCWFCHEAAHIFGTTQNELIDSKGPENIICAIMK